MATSNIKATRMELLTTRKKHKMATKGHKLLESKRDQLMAAFRQLIKVVKGRRKEIEQQVLRSYGEFLCARALMGKEEMEYALLSADTNATLEVKTKAIAGIQIPKFEYRSRDFSANYSLMTTPSQLDTSLKMLSETMKELVELAEFEVSIQRLGKEIETTRRRVNALEHILIPELEGIIKYIQMKLDEMERSTFVTLSRLKSMEEKET